MGADENNERRRIARALWGYSLQAQRPFAGSVGITYDRLRKILGTGDTPTMDELVAMCDATETPREFALYGFDLLNDPRAGIALAREVAELRAALGELVRPMQRAEPEVGGLALPREFQRRLRAARQTLERHEKPRTPGEGGRAQGGGGS